MTGPGPGDPMEGPTAETGTTRTVGDYRAIAILIAVGIALRLIIAYVLLAPGTGFGVDVQAFRYWADNLAQLGPFGFYDRGFFADYTPGYLYVLWLIGIVGRFLGGAGDLIKLPAIIADGVLAYLVWSMVRELGGSRRAGLIGAAFVLFNPVTWFDSSIWGQVDSVGTVFLLLAVRELWRGRMIPATALATIAAIIKPQFGILVPIAAVVILHRYLVKRPERGPKPGVLWGPLASIGIRRPDREGPIDLVSVLVAGAGTAFVLSLPFGLWPWDLVRKIVTTAAQYSYLTVNAYNPWALIPLDGNGMAANGTWVLDVARDPGQAFLAFGPVPAVLVGTALLLGFIAALCFVAWRRDDARTLLVVITVMAIAFFVVPTRVHERYLYPAFALAAILAGTSMRWRIAYVVLAVASFLNLYAILTLPFYENPGISDWLGIADLIRSPAGVAVVATAHVGVFVWALTRLRPSAVAQDAAEARADLLREEGASVGATAAATSGPGPGRRTGRPGADAASGAATASAAGGAGTPGAASQRVSRAAAAAATAAAAAAPSASRAITPDGDEPEGPEETPAGAGIAGWFRGLARYRTRDRSALLAGERGGRLDRLDLWILLVLVVAALVLRTYRLAEPYRMHFDEVYHARTATEFLQDWRYGIRHDIYEYTHPHFAKYAMAVGIMAFADDRTVATSEVGSPVLDAAIEARWSDPTMPADRAGDRLYLATGDGVLAYDLASRDLVARIDAPGARSLAVDAGSHRLLIGTATGMILTLDTASALDTLRVDGTTDATLPVPDVLSMLDGAVERLYVTTDGAVIAAELPGDGLVTLDAFSGATYGRLTIPGRGGMSDGGSAPTIVVDTSQVTDAATLAADLARIAGLDETTTRDRITAAAGASVVVGGADQDVKKAVEEAVGEGTLPGVTVESRARLAVASDAGVGFVDPVTATVADTVALENGTGASDVAEVGGVGNPAIYVVGGTTLSRIDLGQDSGATAPQLVKTLTMPGEVRRVLFDGASQQVHVLGIAPDGSGDTIYVVEPNGISVYADARLPFTATAWAMDSDWQRPAGDRQQILAFSAEGASASVDVGHHAFAWRFPGVIFGALTVAVLFLLLRLLFRRRSVAVIAGILALADGMMFVQSRIAMNDVYVGFFILAAFTVFAALWTGRWKGWLAFVLALPLVGVLLGLGLASKWVALYALGGVGILVLARSALGRIIIVLALAAISATLGYMAIATSPTATTSSGNIFFLALMIGLTLLAVVVSVLHPIAWSLEEMRFAVYVPGALGIAGALVGFAMGVGTIPPEGGSPSLGLLVLAASGALIALSILAIVGFRVGAMLGVGPLAPPREPDDPANLLPPSDPAPQGWLRPGAGWGLPVLWMVVSLALIPVAVYVISYLPWVALGNRFTESFPAGNAGQTLIDLTRSMYDYHNNLRATHAASSPWWAWPFDLKPVWFYQASFDRTSAAIYDTGNLGIWWMGIVGLGFTAWQAFRRRSLALALIGIGSFVMWLPWVRIDRATFQYHYYTALTFLLGALAYLIAEVRHGPSRRTWLLVRVTAAIAVMGPALMWIFRLPLCAVVGVDKAYKDSPACAASVGQLVVTERVAAIVAVLFVGGLLLAWQIVALDRAARQGRQGSISAAEARARRDRHLIAIAGIAAAAAIVLVLSGFLSDEVNLIDVNGIRPELVALAALIPLGICAYVIVTARDTRRFALGFIWAVTVLFIFFYPNISALPLPSQLFNAYQGILPTWLYVFQFPVNTDPPVSVKLLDVWPAVLFVALLATCVVVAYSTFSWRVALAERAAMAAGLFGGGGADDGETQEA